mmetsp:Transcript_7735/g.10110  ORF Transcript_7735/g.10110 Transcript_7735/m.10110 type:complete len:152 (-) Transcript_7735:171-626(-)
MNTPLCYLEEHFDSAFPEGIPVGLEGYQYTNLSLVDVKQILWKDNAWREQYHRYYKLFVEFVALSLNVKFWPNLLHPIVKQGQPCEYMSVEDIWRESNCYLAALENCTDTDKAYQMSLCSNLVNRNYQFGKYDRGKLRCPGWVCSDNLSMK